MIIATHTLSFVLRLLFGCLSFSGLVLVALRRDLCALAHVLMFGAVACVMASGCVVDFEVQKAVALAVVYASLLLCDCAFVAGARACPNLFLVPVLLTGIGASIVFDTAPASAVKFCVFAAAGAIGSVVLGIVAKRRCDFVASSFVPFAIVSVLLCAMPLVPGVGIVANGAKCWAHIGPFAFQPSEFGKVALAVSLSGYLAANARRLRELNARGFLPITLVFFLALALELVVNDLGTGIVMFSLFASMLSLCSKRSGIVYGATLLACVVVLVAVASSVSAHVAARFAAWSDPYVDPQGIGYQSIKGIETMSNGGLFGTGLGFGLRYSEVPEVYSDYVFAAIVEELGLMGGLCVCLSFVVLSVVVARTAWHLPEASFERNLMLGGGGLIACQAFIIVGGVVGVMPLTGVTLPFVSLGGSSMLSCFALVGIMGGCAAASGRGRERALSFAPILSAGAVAVAMVLCVASVVGMGGGFRLIGTTSRDLTYGKVLTSDGVVLAESVRADDGTETRRYPEGTLAAHLLGEASGGIEPRVCSRMTFSQGNPFLNAFALPETADDTTLTIDSNIQSVAEEQLEDVTGAIVVMDVSTGAVLGMASSPSYDVADDFEAGDDGDVSYLNRATGALYAPGSTFKVVTMAAALENDVATSKSVYTGDPLYLNSGEVVSNYRDASYGDITLGEALEVSSNTAFAQLALRMGADEIEGMCERLGFNASTCSKELGASDSVYVSPVDDYSLAWSAVGQPTWEDGTQYGPSATVLQMCSVMATIANGGVRETPYLVESGPLLSERPNGVVAMSSQSAKELWQMMSASSGTSKADGEVAGKTGTAQSGDGTLCWYICASDDVAVACCVESDASGLGATVAKPRALKVLYAAL